MLREEELKGSVEPRIEALVGSLLVQAVPVEVLFEDAYAGWFLHHNRVWLVVPVVHPDHVVGRAEVAPGGRWSGLDRISGHVLDGGGGAS